MEIPIRSLSKIPEEFLNGTQLCEVLEVSPKTLKKILTHTNNPLPHTKVSGAIRVHRSVLVSWLSSRTPGVTFTDPGYGGK
jgi:hypothetical protein